MTRAADLAELGSAYAGAQAFGHRNKIINGDFRIWQRGSVINVGAGAAAYTADRWLVSNATGQTSTVNRVAVVPGAEQTDGMYYLGCTWSAASFAGQYLSQRIEDLRQFANRTITVSFDTADSVATSITVIARMNYGTGGSPSATQDISATVSISSSFAATGRKSITLTIPSTSGKTYGTNNDSFLEILFVSTISGAHTFYLGQVQVEEGSQATPFERRPIGMELALCQRYYEAFGAGVGGGVLASQSTASMSAVFKVPKRVAPAIAVRPLALTGATKWTVSRVSGTAFEYTYTSVGTDNLNSRAMISPNGASLNISLTGWTPVAYDVVLIMGTDFFTADAEL